MLERWKRRARSMRRDTYAIYLACRDPRVPWYAKTVAVAVLAYALSPVDLIPDFIPVLGYLDDLVLVPVGIYLVARLIPTPLMLEHRAAAADGRAPQSTAGLILVVLLWTAAVALTAFALGRYVL